MQNEAKDTKVNLSNQESLHILSYSFTSLYYPTTYAKDNDFEAEDKVTKSLFSFQSSFIHH